MEIQLISWFRFEVKNCDFRGRRLFGVAGYHSRPSIVYLVPQIGKFNCISFWTKFFHFFLHQTSIWDTYRHISDLLWKIDKPKKKLNFSNRNKGEANNSTSIRLEQYERVLLLMKPRSDTSLSQQRKKSAQNSRPIHLSGAWSARHKHTWNANWMVRWNLIESIRKLLSLTIEIVQRSKNS